MSKSLVINDRLLLIFDDDKVQKTIDKRDVKTCLVLHDQELIKIELENDPTILIDFKDIASINDKSFKANLLSTKVFGALQSSESNTFSEFVKYFESKVNFSVFHKQHKSSTFPRPLLYDVTGVAAEPNVRVSVELVGAYFTEATKIELNDHTVSQEFLSDSRIRVSFDANSELGKYDLTLTNGSASTVRSSWLSVQESTWYDYRTGGYDIKPIDIKMHPNLTMERSIDGISFKGSRIWRSWVKFQHLLWERGQNKKLSIILKSGTSRSMFGIGSDKIDETNASQHVQAETLAYMSSATVFWGMYGNAGTPGVRAYYRTNGSIGIPTGMTYKLVITNDGSRGGTMSLYEMSTPTDKSSWDDDTLLLGERKIEGLMDPKQVNLMPFLIPDPSGLQTIVGIKLE